MRKTTMTKPILKTSGASVDLRRWCVECAIRWPIYAQHAHGALYGGQQAGHIGQMYQQPPSMADHDVIARADKILQWVTK